jgi:sortase A
LPGKGGNSGIAAHRDGFFRGLGKIVRGDKVLLQTPSGARTYRVEFTSIVEPDDTRLLAPAGKEALTLVTCYPFHYVGPAPQRFLVRAVLDPTL